MPRGNIICLRSIQAAKIIVSLLFTDLLGHVTSVQMESILQQTTNCLSLSFFMQVSTELAKILLHLDGCPGVENFTPLRFAAMVAVIVTDPVLVRLSNHPTALYLH